MDVSFTQIKEKFGVLRVYVDMAGGTSEAVHAAIDNAAAESFRTCGFCGAPGILRHARGWCLTLCDKHASYEYRDLGTAFEVLTDPNGDVVNAAP